MGTWRNAVEVADLGFASDDEFDAAVASTADGWFGDRRGIPEQDFIDRFVSDHGTDWDMDSYDSPAAREILKRARRYKRQSA